MGYRPHDSFAMHKDLCDGTDDTYYYDFSHPLISVFEVISKKNLELCKDIRPFEGMRKGLGTDCLYFDSYFENGNLDKVVMVNTYEYDLYMRCDANT